MLYPVARHLHLGVCCSERLRVTVLGAPSSARSRVACRKTASWTFPTLSFSLLSLLPYTPAKPLYSRFCGCILASDLALGPPRLSLVNCPPRGQPRSGTGTGIWCGAFFFFKVMAKNCLLTETRQWEWGKLTCPCPSVPQTVVGLCDNQPGPTRLRGLDETLTIFQAIFRTTVVFIVELGPRPNELLHVILILGQVPTIIPNLQLRK